MTTLVLILDRITQASSSDSPTKTSGSIGTLTPFFRIGTPATSPEIGARWLRIAPLLRQVRVHNRSTARKKKGFRGYRQECDPEDENRSHRRRRHAGGSDGSSADSRMIPGFGTAIDMARTSRDPGWRQAEVFGQPLQKLGDDVSQITTLDNSPSYQTVARRDVAPLVNGCFLRYNSYEDAFSHGAEKIGYGARGGTRARADVKAPAGRAQHAPARRYGRPLQLRCCAARWLNGEFTPPDKALPQQPHCGEIQCQTPAQTSICLISCPRRPKNTSPITRRSRVSMR